MSESFDIELGNPLPLSVTSPAGGPPLFWRVRIYDSADAQVAGSPFDLTQVGATRRYTGPSFTPLAVGTFVAHFIPFLDAGRTIEARRFKRVQDSYVVKPVGAVPGDAMALTPGERTTLVTLVDTTLSASHGAAGWEGTENTRPHLGVAYISVGTQLRVAVHAVRDGVRVTPVSFSMTFRNPDGTTLFSLTDASPGVVLDVDDVYRVTLTQAIVDGFLYRAELTVSDAIGAIGPRVITVGVSS